MPYQLVPSETKLMMSMASRLAVIVGPVPPGHSTPVNVAVAGVPDDGCVTMSVNRLPAAAAGSAPGVDLSRRAVALT